MLYTYCKSPDVLSKACDIQSFTVFFTMISIFKIRCLYIHLSVILQAQFPDSFLRLFSFYSKASLSVSLFLSAHCWLLGRITEILGDYTVQPKSLHMTELTADPPRSLFLSLLLILSFIQGWQLNYYQVMLKILCISQSKFNLIHFC